MKIEEIIGKNLKHLRLQRGLTQEAVAGKIGLHVNFYARCERGERVPSIVNLVKLAKILKVKPYLLLKDADEP